MIAGPQASGKSTVATALATELRRQHELVALVELDQIAAMALPTLPDWGTAHHIFASVAAQWASAGQTCVIAEGIGSQDEVSILLQQAPLTAAVVTVVVTTPFDVALPRAQADLTRGVSRQPEYLARRYERWQVEMTQIDSDVLLDTSSVSVEKSVDLIRVAIDFARRADPPSR